MRRATARTMRATRRSQIVVRDAGTHRAGWLRSRLASGTIAESPLFLGRAHVDLEGPGVARLLVQILERIHDAFEVDQTFLAEAARVFGKSAHDLVAAD